MSTKNGECTDHGRDDALLIGAAPLSSPIPMSDRPECGSVSVVIPCYNYGRYLRKCVDSVLEQHDVEVDVLVIDDCSTDNTAEVGVAVARDPRVSFRRHESNKGHIATYNEGLEWASGAYTVLLSADDLLAPGALARAVAVLDTNADVGMVYGRAVRFETEPPVLARGAYQVQVWKGADWIAKRCRTATCTIASPEVTVRTSLYKALGGYRPDLPHTADLEMWLRIASHAGVAYVRGADQAFYRVHAASMSRTAFSASIHDLQGRKGSFDALFEGMADPLPNGPSLRARANRALARDALWRACRAFDRRRLDAVGVDELEQFAKETYPGATRLREYHGLRLRRRLGPRWSPWVQFALPSVYLHRVRDWLWWRRLSRSGV